jgi:hypothetical protein
MLADRPLIVRADSTPCNPESADTHPIAVAVLHRRAEWCRTVATAMRVLGYSVEDAERLADELLAHPGF